jgi:hypothetical protein
VGTVIPDAQRGKADRKQRWERSRRAERLNQYRALRAQGLSQRQAAKMLDLPRTTWLAAGPQVGECFESVSGLAFLHRLALAFHVVCVEMGACGMRLAPALSDSAAASAARRPPDGGGVVPLLRVGA